MSTAVDISPDIRVADDSRFPAGPTFLERVRARDSMLSAPLETMQRLKEAYGDLVHYKQGGRHIFQCNHPALVGELLARDSRYHHRSLVIQKAKMVLGDGLLASEEPLHLRQRRLAQPAFHRDRISAYGAVIGQYAKEATADWQSGDTRNLHEDMQRLSLRIIGKTLFDSELESVNVLISRALDAFMVFSPLVFLPAADFLLSLPLPQVLRIKRSRRQVDEIVQAIITKRRSEGSDHGDLLSMLLHAQDTDGGTGGMSDEQVRDETVNALLAGNETIANGVAFALWLIAMHPDAQRNLQEEARERLKGRAATAEDYEFLPFTRACLAEAMRLYPPVWSLARTAIKEYEWRGFHVPRGSLLLTAQWVIHRDDRFFAHPEKFMPERFLQSNSGDQANFRYTYFPFGGGSRQCIGEGLAWMEGVLILATIFGAWRLTVPLGALAPKLDPKISLRPQGRLHLRLESIP
jgi:cytochrome P450